MVPVRFVLRTASHCSRVVSSSGPKVPVPAAATQPWSAPVASTAALTAAMTSSSVATSPAAMRTSGPGVASSAAFASSSLAWRRPMSVTTAPSFRRCVAQARPIPVAPPVMSTWRLVSVCSVMGAILPCHIRSSTRRRGLADQQSPITLRWRRQAVSARSASAARATCASGFPSLKAGGGAQLIVAKTERASRTPSQSPIGCRNARARSRRWRASAWPLRFSCSFASSNSTMNRNPSSSGAMVSAQSVQQIRMRSATPCGRGP